MTEIPSEDMVAAFEEEQAADVADQLQAGREVAHTAENSVDGEALAPASEGDEGMDLNEVVEPDETILAESLFETDEGTYVERLVLTDKGVILQTFATTGEDDQD